MNTENQILTLKARVLDNQDILAHMQSTLKDLMSLTGTTDVVQLRSKVAEKFEVEVKG